MNNASNGRQHGEILEHLADDLQNVRRRTSVDAAHTLVTQLILIVVEGEEVKLFRILIVTLKTTT